MAVAAKKDEVLDDTSAAPREAPTIPTKSFSWNSQGFNFREAFVRLPKGVILADLNEHPEIWKTVQSAGAIALRRFDKVRVVDFDETWLADATVSFADRTTVILCGIKRTEMPERAVQLFEDQLYKTEWAGSGYCVIRKSDGVLMDGKTHATPEGARHALMALYPKQVV